MDENTQDRHWMIKYWAQIRTHPDKEWSEQQKELINSLIE